MIPFCFFFLQTLELFLCQYSLNNLSKFPQRNLSSRMYLYLCLTSGYRIMHWHQRWVLCILAHGSCIWIILVFIYPNIWSIFIDRNKNRQCHNVFESRKINIITNKQTKNYSKKKNSTKYTYIWVFTCADSTNNNDFDETNWPTFWRTSPTQKQKSKNKKSNRRNPRINVHVCISVNVSLGENLFPWTTSRIFLCMYSHCIYNTTRHAFICLMMKQ